MVSNHSDDIGSISGVFLLSASRRIIQAALQTLGMESNFDCGKEMIGISPALDCVTILVSRNLSLSPGKVAGGGSGAMS